MPDLEKKIELDVIKVDGDLGLVFAWGMVVSKAGKPYLDTDDEGFSAGEMLKAVTDFGAEAVRPTDEMHDEEQDGTVVHSFPITDEIAKVYGIHFDRSDPDQVTEGWMVAVRPSASVLAKFQDGTYTGFSVGGAVESWEPAPLEATG